MELVELQRKKHHRTFFLLLHQIWRYKAQHKNIQRYATSSDKEHKVKRTLSFLKGIDLSHHLYKYTKLYKFAN